VTDRTIHFRGALNVRLDENVAHGFLYGDELVLTDRMVELSRDRNGSSHFDLIDDEGAQIAHFGEVKFAAGPFPADLPRYVAGSIEEAEAREVARVAAWAVPNPDERRAALLKVEVDYGKATSTSKTLRVEKGSEEVRRV
jgi:hypothetical protein